MNVVDSSGWLEYFVNGPNSEFFAPAITNLGKLVVPAISIYEVFKRTLLERGERNAHEALVYMQQGYVVDLNSDLAVEAARLSAVERLPMADSIILATASIHHAVLWTQDADLARFANVQYIKK